MLIQKCVWAPANSYKKNEIAISFRKKLSNTQNKCRRRANKSFLHLQPAKAVPLALSMYNYRLQSFVVVQLYFTSGDVVNQPHNGKYKTGEYNNWGVQNLL